MVRIGICDDNTEELKKLENLLQVYSKQNNVEFDIKTFTNGYLFLDNIHSKKTFQICFLDIYMPALSGIDIARELRLLDKTIHLIFTTSSKEFALEGYSLQATNYLLKPLSKNSFFDALNQVLEKINIEKNENVCVATSTGFQLVAPNFMTYIEAANNYCIVHLRNSSFIHTTANLTQMSEMLNKYSNFVIISRSILLNFDSIVGFDNDKFILDNGSEIYIPRRKKKELSQKFLEYSINN